MASAARLLRVLGGELWRRISLVVIFVKDWPWFGLPGRLAAQVRWLESLYHNGIVSGEVKVGEVVGLGGADELRCRRSFGGLPWATVPGTSFGSTVWQLRSSSCATFVECPVDKLRLNFLNEFQIVFGEAGRCVSSWKSRLRANLPGRSVSMDLADVGCEIIGYGLRRSGPV